MRMVLGAKVEVTKLYTAGGYRHYASVKTNADYWGSTFVDQPMGETYVLVGRTRKEAARRAAAKLRKLAAEFDKIAEGEK